MREEQNAFWILHATLMTQNNSREVIRGHLRIENQRITEITSTLPAKFARSPQDINASGLVLFPGFIQTHTHLCQTLFRNQADNLELLDWLSKKIWPMEACHTPETLATSAAMGIYELLASGTTCILDMGTVHHTDSIFEEAMRLGIRANIGKCLMDDPTGTPPYLRQTTKEALDEATQLYDKWNGKANDRIRASFAPRFALSCTESLLSSVRTLSEERNALIHTHASENQKEIELVREKHQKDNIEYFDQIGLTCPHLVLAHAVWLTNLEKEILRKSGSHVTHCPSSNLKLASGFAAVPDLLARGINVSLGADGAPCNNNLDIFQEMRLAALIHKPTFGPRSMRAMEVLDMATRNGAKALHWFDQIGSIEIGKKADLVAVTFNTPTNSLPPGNRGFDPETLASALVYSTQRHQLRWTMVDGELLYFRRKIRNLSRGPLLTRIRRSQKQILEQMRNLV